ncbi:hypothetical protein TVAG_221150, partial [Trichomonas vaginalis G3]
GVTENGEDASSKIKFYFTKSVENQFEVFNLFVQAISDPTLDEIIKVATLSLLYQAIHSLSPNGFWRSSNFQPIKEAIQSSVINSLFSESVIIRNESSKVITAIFGVQNGSWPSCLEYLGNKIENSSEIDEISAVVYAFNDLINDNFIKVVESSKNLQPLFQVFDKTLAVISSKATEPQSCEIYYDFLDLFTSHFQTLCFRLDLCSRIVESLLGAFPFMEFQIYRKSHRILLNIVVNLYECNENVTEFIQLIFQNVCQGFNCTSPELKSVSIDFFIHIHKMEMGATYNHRLFSFFAEQIFNSASDLYGEINLNSNLIQNDFSAFETYLIKLMNCLFIENGNQIFEQLSDVIFQNISSDDNLVKYIGICMLESCFVEDDNKYTDLILNFIAAIQEQLFQCFQCRDAHVIIRLLEVFSKFFLAYPREIRKNDEFCQLLWENFTNLVRSNPFDYIQDILCKTLRVLIPIEAENPQYFKIFIEIAYEMIKTPRMANSDLIHSPFMLIQEVISFSTKEHFPNILEYIQMIVPDINQSIKNAVSSDENKYEIVVLQDKMSIVSEALSKYYNLMETLRIDPNITNQLDLLFVDFINPWIELINRNSFYQEELLDLLCNIIRTLPHISQDYAENIFNSMKEVIINGSPAAQGKAGYALAQLSSKTGKNDEYIDAVSYMIDLLETGNEVFTKQFFADMMYGIAIIIKNQQLNDFNNPHISKYFEILRWICFENPDISNREARNEVSYLYRYVFHSYNELVDAFQDADISTLSDIYDDIFNFIKKTYKSKIQNLTLYSAELKLLVDMTTEDKREIRRKKCINFASDYIKPLFVFIKQLPRNQNKYVNLIRMAEKFEEDRKRF